MKKTIKKIFVVSFFVALFLCMTALFASAETVKYNNKNYEVQVEGEYKYFILAEDQLTDDDKYLGAGATIIKYTGTSASVAIPSTLGGQPVMCVSKEAFKGNKALQTVTIGESVKAISYDSFRDCTGLQTVLIAKNVEVIYSNAFNGCTALKTVTFQKGSVLRSIGESAFNNCTSLNNFTIPETVETIGNFAFRNCDSMTEIIIPDSVTSLGIGVFFHCNSLIDSVIGNGVTNLPSKSGSSSDNWGTDRYVHGTFEGCISLKTVAIGNSVESIGQDCFAGTALETVVIPDNVITVGAGAFYDCSSLTKISIGDGVTSLGESVFEYCDLLTDISIGKGVITIGNYAFSDCDKLKNITIPSNVTTIGIAIFFHCDNLESVVIGNGVTSLPSKSGSSNDNWGTDRYVHGTFEGCEKLKNVSIGSAVKTIGQDCFAGTALETVVIPDNVITISAGAFEKCSVLTSIIIGNGVTSMGEAVFRNSDLLTDVSIGKGVVTIGNYAFWDCDGLKMIAIPSNVTTIGVGIFYHCNALESVVIGNGVTSLPSKSGSSSNNWGTDRYVHGIFEGCINLKEVTLGSGIISIGTDTFAGTQITSLTIPAKVSTLSKGAFAGAKQLKDIYFTGNWAASVGDSLFSDIAEGYTVHYISGKIGYDDLSYNKATFTPVTVTFDNNNDDVFAAPTESQILAPVGGYVIEPINPTAFGYHFVGWYKDSACRQPWNFAIDKVSSDVTIYAKWNAVDEVAPIRPENISTETKDGNSITLKWSAVDGATGYNVYVDEEKVNDSTILTTSYKVSGLESSTTYEFVVRAVNSKGESPDSLIFADRTTDHVHAFGEWTVVKEATCGADGEKTRSCECGTAEKEVIPATGTHTYGDWYTTLEPTCVDKGEQTRSCSACGKKETKEVSATGEHNYGNWVVVKEATQDTEGLKEHSCNDCSKTESQVIPSLSSVLKGDVNGDGKISAADARMVLRAAAKLEVLSADVFEIAEVTGDGKITAADARKILRVSARLEEM